MIVVSACLAGVECRYNGSAYPVAEVVEWVRRGEALPLCPEVLGGLATPRSCAERCGTAIATKDGQDFTAAYQRGARRAAEIARIVDCKRAILKARSPSCGCGLIYDGTFSGTLVRGDGMFSALLKEQGIVVETEESLLPARDASTE